MGNQSLQKKKQSVSHRSRRPRTDSSSRDTNDQSSGSPQDGSTATLTAQSGCPIFKLPIEIRLLIYEFLFQPEEHDIKLMAERHPHEDWRSGDAWLTTNQRAHHSRMVLLRGIHLPFVYKQKLPDILLTSKLIYFEASPVFYDCRTIYFGAIRDIRSTLREATNAQLATIRRVRLMQRNTVAKNDSPFGPPPDGDVAFWDPDAIKTLQKCSNLKHFTMDLGFFWPEMEHSKQLKDIRRLRGLRSITFLGNDGQQTNIPKWSYVLQQGLRQDLRADCEARRLVAFRFYEVNTPWLESIRADVLQPRNDYFLRERDPSLSYRQ